MHATAIAQYESAPDTCATRQPATYQYHLLRAATEQFQSNIPALEPAQRRQAVQAAERSWRLEERVLRSPEARDVVIPAAQVDQAVQAVADRYPSEAAFRSDLARNALDPERLRQALYRELQFDAVMRRVGAGQAPITEADERLFFELHRARFTRPETRKARHLLITVNDDYAENREDAARARIEALADRLHPDVQGRGKECECGEQGDRDAQGDPGDALDCIQAFVRLARRHSECPTAMEGGKLGEVQRGQLFPELDAALFNLPEGGVSGPIRSELGFHLLLCERIQAGQALSFSRVRQRIRETLEARRRRDAQRAWLAQLPDLVLD